MYKHLKAVGGASLLVSVSMIAAQAQTTPPDPPKFDAQGQVNFVGIKDIWEYRALPEYHEPEWVTTQFVDTGRLPPVKDRLPKEPLVFKTSNMPDGIGVYGDVMRHVTGGRPQGWNYEAGQSQGWGGLDIAMYECLTRTAQLFEIKADELEPLPNLAKSWEWSADGHALTMHLIEGAKWSDGVPFTSEDIMFYWDDNVLDPNVTPTGGASPETFGIGTTLKAVDDYTVQWTFEKAFPKQYLYQMAYGTFCPGPAHILKPQHPKYSENTYDQDKNAFPPQWLGMPVMGAWVPVEYRPDDLIVLRRNPYYWKVDEAGNQLPYLNEITYKLSTWPDRDVQAVAGTGDLSNLESTESFVEALKHSSEPDAPARLEFGPRIVGNSLLLNFSANGWGEPDERAQAVRELNRNLDFRKAITKAIDRQRLGDSLIKGPFTAIYPGGLFSGTSFYDKASTVYYPFDLEGAKADLVKAGLVDTDGDGIVNFPAGTAGGKNVEIEILADAEHVTDKNLAEGVVAMMEPLGIRVIAKYLTGTPFYAAQQAGQFDWIVWVNLAEMISVVQNTENLAPIGPRSSWFHRAPGDTNDVDLLPFEQELVDIVDKFIATNDNSERIELMKQYQKVFTENVYSIGLAQFPGALIINKRFANIPAGTPIFLFNWAEDSIMRERVFVPKDKQKDYELFPKSLPGAPGGPGPVT